MAKKTRLDVVRAFGRYFPGDQIGKSAEEAADLIARGLCVKLGATKPAADPKPAPAVAAAAAGEVGAPPAQG